MNSIPLAQHKTEIDLNARFWNQKPILRKIYREFHQLIASQLSNRAAGKIVELGSGICSIKDVIPNCICTDLTQNSGIDQVENAYSLSFKDGEVSNLLLFDVFHHLQYPGTAFREFDRVVNTNGRIIIFEPYISLIGWLVYGALHHEPVAWTRPITPFAPPSFDPKNHEYFAAQGNATRIFFLNELTSNDDFMSSWKIVHQKRISAWDYALSGGYSKPQMYPDFLHPFFKAFEKLLDLAPGLTALRGLIVLEKKLGA